jgi:long-chain acyl-CoA synthetase
MLLRNNIATLVDDWRRNAERIAIVDYRGNRRYRMRYGELADLADRFALEIGRRGIAEGDRVLLWAPNSAAWVAAFFGCVLRGAIVVPLDATGTSEFAARVLAETSPRLLVGDPALLSTLHSGNIPSFALDDLKTLPPASPLAGPALTRDTPLQILFTSGTTSDPKGIVHTHGNLLASVEPIEREYQRYRRAARLFGPLRILHTLPLSHVFGQFMGLWLPPVLGAEVHFESRMEAALLAGILRRERITVLAAVPRLLDLLRTYLLQLEAGLAAEVGRLPPGIKASQRIWRFRRIHRRMGWRFWAFVCGGAALSPELESFWNALGYAVVQGYGMTETAALITLNHPFKIARGSVGKPLPGREIRISPEGEISVRGPMVSTSTWRGGRVEQREDPWLHTGDLVQRDTAGNLRFVGRSGEAIITAAGLNLHPEDVEAALLQQPEITACAVIAVPTRSVPHASTASSDIVDSVAPSDPVAILVAPGGATSAQIALDRANRSLAEYQRVHRSLLWPGADLPRTSTGKVQKRLVTAWAAAQANTVTATKTPSDPLLALVAEITGRIQCTEMSEAARLDGDLHLDSLARLQLGVAIETRFGVAIEDARLAGVQTLGELRAAVATASGSASPISSTMQMDGASATDESALVDHPQTLLPTILPQPVRQFRYPRWPWWKPVQWLRTAFQEVIVRPVVWLLLRPRIAPIPMVAMLPKPMLLIANHATLFDAALVLYGLPSSVRRRVAIAAGGEMLDDWRRSRNQGSWWANLFAPVQLFLLTALFNIFPLPRTTGIRESFAHVGEALDVGYHVLIFPEGHRSEDGTLQPFRSGIGLLAEESRTAVLPVALRGMDLLVTRRQRWFHAGLVEIVVGTSKLPEASESATALAERLHGEMEHLLCGAVDPQRSS